MPARHDMTDLNMSLIMMQECQTVLHNIKMTEMSKRNVQDAPWMRNCNDAMIHYRKHYKVWLLSWTPRCWTLCAKNKIRTKKNPINGHTCCVEIDLWIFFVISIRLLWKLCMGYYLISPKWLTYHKFLNSIHSCMAHGYFFLIAYPT